MGVNAYKRTAYPAYAPRTVEFDAKTLATLPARHMRAGDGELIAAEGAEQKYSVLRIPTGLYAIGGDPYIWSERDSKLYRLGETEEPINLSRKPNALLPFCDREGNEALYVVAGDRIIGVTAAGTHTVASGKGGSCGAVFKERIFAAQGDTVYYSAPLSPATWDEERGKGGKIEFPSADGEFLAAVAFREQLYFFRERGIMQLRANGDDFNFKAIPYKFGAGTICAGTVADCGDRIMFFTDKGLYSFAGASCVRAEGSLFSQIADTPKSAAGCGGNYYAVCTHKTFGKCIYCYEPAKKSARFILQSGEYLAAGNEVWTLAGSTIYKLTQKGAPSSGTCRVELGKEELCSDKTERILDGVTVHGEGDFSVTACTENGLEYTAEGAAEEMLRFPALVRGGDFTVTVAAQGADFHIRKIAVHMREA